MKTENNEIKSAVGIAMKRTKVGYIVKEHIHFAFTNEEQCQEAVDKFAKEHDVELVEVWCRDAENYSEMHFHKAFTYLQSPISYILLNV